jgi:hypothetical protein
MHCSDSREEPGRTLARSELISAGRSSLLHARMQRVRQVPLEIVAPFAGPPGPTSKRPKAELLYIVEAILDMRLDARGSEQCRVRWYGYGRDGDTWEPADDIPPGLIAEFKASMALGLVPTERAIRSSRMRRTTRRTSWMISTRWPAGAAACPTSSLISAGRRQRNSARRRSRTSRACRSRAAVGASRGAARRRARRNAGASSGRCSRADATDERYRAAGR